MKLYTSKVIAEWLGLTERRVRQLRDEGVISEDRQGLYDLHTTVLKYINYLRGVGAVSLQTERMKLTAEKRKAAEMDNEQRRGEMHSADDIRRGLTGISLNIRNRLLLLPAKLSPELKTMDGQAEIFDLLKKEIEEALEELSKADFILTETGDADIERSGDKETGSDGGDSDTAEAHGEAV